MKKLRQRHPSVFLLLSCYVVAVGVALLLHAGQWAYNRILYANGTFAPGVLNVEDFTLVEMEPMEGGGLLTTGGDPQMLLRDTQRRVDTVRTQFGYLNEPLVETVFYAKEGQPYSVRRMDYARRDGDDRVYYLPPSGGQSLRLDPDAAMGNILRGGEIAINKKRPFYAFFSPSATEGALLLAGPALLACVLSVAFEAARTLRRRKGGTTE